METALSELGEANDLVSLAVQCLSNDSEEIGYIEDAASTLSEATSESFVLSKYVTLGVDKM